MASSLASEFCIFMQFMIKIDFHGKLFSRFGTYPSRGSYFRRKKFTYGQRAKDSAYTIIII